MRGWENAVFPPVAIPAIDALQANIHAPLPACAASIAI